MLSKENFVESWFLYSYKQTEKLFVMIYVLRVKGSFIPSQKLVLNLTFNRLPRTRPGSDSNTHRRVDLFVGQQKKDESYHEWSVT